MENVNLETQNISKYLNWSIIKFGYIILRGLTIKEKK